MPADHALIGPLPDGADPSAYDQLRRRVLWAMPAGLYLLASKAGTEQNLMTTSLAIQVSISPKLIATSIEIGSKTLSLVRESGSFTLCLLSKDERALVRKFVKPASFDEESGQLNGVEVMAAVPSGAPVPAIALAYLDCHVEREVVFTSHALLVGEVMNAVVLDEARFSSGEVLSMADVKMSYGG